MGVGGIYRLAPNLRILTEVRYQHLETSRTISSDEFDLTQNLTGSRLLVTFGIALGG